MSSDVISTNESVIIGLNNKADTDLTNTDISDKLDLKFDKTGGEITNSLIGHTNKWDYGYTEDELYHSNSFIKIINDNITHNNLSLPTDLDSNVYANNLLTLYTKDGKEFCGIQGGYNRNTKVNFIKFYVYDFTGTKTIQFELNIDENDTKHLIDYNYFSDSCIRLMNGLQICNYPYNGTADSGGYYTINFEKPFKDRNYSVAINIGGITNEGQFTARYAKYPTYCDILTIGSNNVAAGGIEFNLLAIGRWK